MSTESISRNDLISPRLFVKSVRDLGLETIDAINEFVDNSFDANAQNIWITIQPNNRGGLTLIVEDDGEGMEEDEIVEALKFGGQIDRDRGTTGKFGFGLPSSAFCQADRTEVYSKTANSDDFYFGRLDVNELLEMANIEIPNEEQKDPPFDDYDLHLDSDAERGTIIILPHLRSPDRKKASSLASYLEDDVSQTQREILEGPREIYINDDAVPIHDPLMWIEESVEVQELEQSNRIDRLEFEYPEYASDSNSVPTVKVDLHILPIQEIVRQNEQKQFDINQRNQGFYIVRENREIGQHQTLSLFKRHNDLNYFRARIWFPEELDELFGVQTNKSRFALDASLRSDLEQSLTKIIDSIRNRIKQERGAAKERYQSTEEITPTELIVNRDTKFLPRSTYNKDRNKSEEQDRKIEQKLRELENEEPSKESQRLEEYYKSILDNDFYFTVKEETPPSGNFYDINWKGKNIQVMINPNHPFYEKFYGQLDEDGVNGTIDTADVKTMVELLLITFAKREDTIYSDEELRHFYQDERRKWTSILFDLYQNVDNYM